VTTLSCDHTVALSYLIEIVPSLGRSLRASLTISGTQKDPSEDSNMDFSLLSVCKLFKTAWQNLLSASRRI
jgi:hypothetical protein